MNDVFLSYAREDRPFATRLVNALTGLGINVWWDYRIGPGEDFARRTEEELERSKSVLVIWSSHSVDSTWVQNEVRRGVERTRVIIPVLIDEVALPLEFSNLEAISLIDWSGDTTHDGFCNVLVAIPSAQTSSIPSPPRPPRRIFSLSRVPLGFGGVAGVVAIVIVLVLARRLWASLFPEPPAPEVPTIPTTVLTTILNPPWGDPPVPVLAPVLAPAPSVSPPPPKSPVTPVVPADKCCDETGNVMPCAKAHCDCPGLKRCP